MGKTIKVKTFNNTMNYRFSANGFRTLMETGNNNTFQSINETPNQGKMTR